MNDKPEKLGLDSMDISAENRAKLKALFPSVFTETVNDKGELVESIDFEKLKAELGTFSDLFESRRERFGLDWPGKKDCMKLIQEPSRATLKPARDESVNFDTTENLFIEGDNLEVLKLLQKSYYGKVKMIYIDPPYNTGKEFIYPDKYSESLETYLEYAGLVDGEGRKFSTNTPNEGRYHTKWLNMMYPRLYLARNLLREDGVIFISIDDNEVANLRKLCDEIFGEENFVANIVWQKKYAATNDAKGFSVMHDHIIVYQKSGLFERLLLPRTLEQNKPYKHDNNDGRGLWRSDNLLVKSFSQSGVFPIVNPNTGQEFWPPEGSCWRGNKDTIQRWLMENRIFFGKNGKGAPQLKRYLNEVQQGRVPVTWWTFQEVGHNDAANKELKILFNSKSPFDTPKPSSLVSQMLKVSSSSNSNDIILDFFAGSCTTAHAVLDLNKEDGGNRKFIMVQLPEPCDEKSEAFKTGYKTIADIGKERIRRVIKNLRSEIEDLRLKEKQNPSLFEDENQQSKIKNLQSLDLGFKVLKLDRSNFKPWERLDADAPEEEIATAIQQHLFHIDPEASQEDILYEILLKAGFMPTEKVTLIEDVGNWILDLKRKENPDYQLNPEIKNLKSKIYSVADGMLLICLEDEITRELIDAVAEAEPMQFICLDQGFKGNDQLKANAVQTFAARNQGRDKAGQIVFRTV